MAGVGLGVLGPLYSPFSSWQAACPRIPAEAARLYSRWPLSPQEVSPSLFSLVSGVQSAQRFPSLRGVVLAVLTLVKPVTRPGLAPAMQGLGT